MRSHDYVLLYLLTLSSHLPRAGHSHNIPAGSVVRFQTLQQYPDHSSQHIVTFFPALYANRTRLCRNSPDAAIKEALFKRTVIDCQRWLECFVCMNVILVFDGLGQLKI